MDVLIAVLLALAVAAISFWIGRKRADKLLEGVRETSAMIEKYEKLKRKDPIAAERLIAEHDGRLKAEWEALRNRAQTDTAAATEFHRRAQNELGDVDWVIEELRRRARKDPEVGAILANAENYAAQLRKDIEWSRPLLPRRS